MCQLVVGFCLFVSLLFTPCLLACFTKMSSRKGKIQGHIKPIKPSKSINFWSRETVICQCLSTLEASFFFSQNTGSFQLLQTHYATLTSQSTHVQRKKKGSSLLFSLLTQSAPRAQILFEKIFHIFPANPAY